MTIFLHRAELSRRIRRIRRSGKVQYLEGLRGVAALQVVLLHFVTGFLPDTAEHAAAPVRIATGRIASR